MKATIATLVLAAYPGFARSATTLTFPAGTYAPVGTELHGLDGWTVSDPGTDLDGDTVPDGRLGFSNTLNGNLGGALGGFYNDAAAGVSSTVYLSREFNGTIPGLSFSASLGIASSTAALPGRDGFGFAFLDAAGSNVFTISFIPIANLANDAYRVGYTIGNTLSYVDDGTGNPVNISHDGLFHLNLSFSDTGANPGFSGSIGGVNFFGTATGLGSATVQRFGVAWDVLQGGNNYLTFSNVTINAVVPEPASATLFGSAMGLLALRRRRA